MSSVFSENLRIYNAAQFKESVSEASNNTIYFTVGKTEAWSNEAAPNQANTSVVNYNNIWRKMIAAKRVFGSGIRHCIPRHNWTSNTVYVAYDDVDTYDFNPNTEFYVVTSDWNVYKCLANNNGAASNTMPISTTTSGTFQTADGYIWKFMYTISAEEQLRFTTDEYMPVKTLNLDDGSLQWQVQNNAVDGAISVVRVLNGGSGYSSNVYVTFDGDGADANAYPQMSGNAVLNIIVDDPGAGYSYATATLVDADGAGSGADLKPIIEPPGGHGADPMRELGGGNLIINPRLRGTESGKIPTVNDIRQIALLHDPYTYGTTNVASNTVTSQYTTLTLSGTSVDYVIDEKVYQGATLATATFSGDVLQWDSANSQIKLTNVLGSVSTDLLIGANSTAARFVSSVTDPELEPYTGRLLYTDNITSISRAPDQTEDFKIILKF